MDASTWLVSFWSERASGNVVIRRGQEAGLLVTVTAVLGLYLDAWTDAGEPVVNVSSLRYGQN